MPAQQKSRKKQRVRKHKDSTYKAKKVSVRLAKHKHTGKLLPYYCTSYALVFFLLALSSITILFISFVASADQQTSTINLSGVVKGKPPELPAKITYPSNKTQFQKSQIEIRGTCIPDTYVEIYRKTIFSGMALCSASGRFNITITLVPGENKIIAMIRDSLGQYGPKSDPVIVFYDLATNNNSQKNPDNTKFINSDPLLIYTEPVQRGITVGQPLKLDFEIDGDSPPYSIAIDWGDGTPTGLDKYKKEGNFSASHQYSKSGQQTIRISGIGGSGAKATIQTIVVVHSLSTPIASTKTEDCDQTKGNFAEYCSAAVFGNSKFIDIMWPAIIVASLMTASFWAGEKIIIRRSKLA